MLKFKPSKLTMALLSSGLMLSSMSYAQESESIEQITKPTQAIEEKELAQKNQTTDDDVNEENSDTSTTLVITGYRGSLIRSIEEKRAADTVSEFLSSDDLGALPDVSIADALTRLPGISAVRTGGQAAEISIRGLSGGFVLATLNGREQVSTSGSRSVEFDQYPSELIASGALYKSQKASLIEGGVAGTIELQTASALQNKNEHTFNLNLRGMYNDRAEEIFDAETNGTRFSMSYQGKFADDTIGLSLGFARLDQPSAATQFIGLDYNGTKDVDGDGDFESISEGFEVQHKGGTEIRNGYVAAIEWIPTESFALKADVFISKFDSEQFARGFRVKFGGPTAHFYNPTVFQENVIGATVVRTGQSFTRVELANDDDSKVDEVANYGFNATWNLTDQFTLSADLSYSGAKSDFQNRLLWSLAAEDATIANPIFDTNVAVNYQLNGLNLPDVSFNQDFTSIDSVMASKYGTYPFEYTDDLTAFKLDAQYEVMDSDWLSSIAVGMRYSERNYDKERSIFEYGSDGSFLSSQPPFRLTSSVATPVGFSGDFAHFPGYLAINIDAVLAAWLPAGTGQPLQTWGVNALGEIDNHSSWSVLQSGEVFENVSSAYFMANIDTLFGELPVTGNAGLRIVHTEQSATMLQNVEGDPLLGAQYIVDEAGLVNDQYAPGIDGISYTDYLPQVNLNFKVTDNSQVRFAAARVMSRAPIEWLSAEVSGSVDTDTFEYDVTSTNSPRLKPFMVDQFDLSYEYYFEETEGAFVAAVFYKDIKTFIDTVRQENFDFSTTNIAVPETYLDPVSLVETPVTFGSLTSRVNNAEGGYIAGLELAYTQVFSMLPEPFNGLGMNLSYAYTDSDINKITNFGGSTVKSSLEGLSRDVLSASVFYELGDFDTRVNVRHRSKFISTQWGVNEQTVFFDGETVVDYQASYQLTDRSQILFQVNNLTDQPTKSYFGTQQQTGTIQFFGRQFFLGMSYSL